MLQLVRGMGMASKQAGLAKHSKPKTSTVARDQKTGDPKRCFFSHGNSDELVRCSTAAEVWRMGGGRFPRMKCSFACFECAVLSDIEYRGPGALSRLF